MAKEQVEHESLIGQRMAKEETIREKIDGNGDRWTKVYFGGGTHFRNWLSQFVELKGDKNVMVEDADSTGFQCYEESGEKMYRIWIKDTDLEDKASDLQDELFDAPFYNSIESYQNRR